MRPLTPLSRWPNTLVLLAASTLVALIAWVDYITGWEWSFFIFYAFPIATVVWKTNPRAGFVFALLCGGAWWAAQFTNNPYQTTSGFAVAVITRFFYFGVLVVAVAEVKAHRESDRIRIETLERSRMLEGEILRTSELEQQRIGRDLHDSLGPHLAAIGYKVSFLTTELRAAARPEAEDAEQLQAMVGEALALSRALARGLFPVQMDGTGLATALEDLACTTSRLTGMTVSFFDSKQIRIEDSESAMHVYRIVQEALNNAARHGKATRVTIILSEDRDAVNVVIADDGIGIESSKRRGNGVGLYSMRYRARALGGHIEFDSKANEGTTVTCHFPMKRIATETTAHHLFPTHE